MSVLSETENWKIINQISKTIKERKYKYKYNYKDIKDIKINIITPKTGWIIYKFANNVFKELEGEGFDVQLSERFMETADINHYFFPANIGYSKYSKVDEKTTFMITHVDTSMKVSQIREWTQKGALGICMSEETMNRLATWGVERNKLCFINPPVDSDISPNKITLGFTFRLYGDVRKRENMFVDIFESIDPRFFRIKIMGSGWDEIVKCIVQKGFEVEYFNEFNKEEYNRLIKSLDYYCYFGFDEGSMGYLDAIAAGVGTIVTPQGYHLDTPIPITYPVRTFDDIIGVLKELEKDRKKSLDFINTWTWNNYTHKHVDIWKYVLGIESMEKLLAESGRYMDGINSVLFDDFEYYEKISSKIKHAVSK